MMAKSGSSAGGAGARTAALEMTGDPLLLRGQDGKVSVSISIRIRRYIGRGQVVVPQGTQPR